MNLQRALLAAAFVAVVPTLASAVPITAGSTLNTNGFAIGQGVAPGGQINTATGLDFTAAAAPNTPTPGVAGSLTAYNGTGSFSALACAGTCGTIQDLLNFSTFAPIAGFYTTTAGVTFDLLTLAAPNTATGALILSGTGQFSGAGFDRTPGVWSLTTQGGANTTFSASTMATSNVPEPATLALLGVGMAGLGMIRKRRA